MTTTTISSLRRDRPMQVDLAAVAALSLLAGIGFHTSFGGWRFMLPVAVATVLGVLVGAFAVVLRLPAIVTAAAALVAFFVVGASVTVFDDTLYGLPTPTALRSMVEGATNGWSQLLTVVPPSGQEGNLLVVPFITCLVAGLLGVIVARRTKAITWPLVFPGAACAVAVLWGTSQPAALLVQGGGFLGISLAWMLHRESVGRGVVANMSGRRRLAWTGGIVLVAVLLAPTLGGSLPYVNADRYVLREHVDPPIDPSQYASPLARYPWYLDPKQQDDVVFSVALDRPLADDVPIRFASMDAYDGQVFAVNTTDANGSGVFVKTGSELPDAPDATGGEAVSMHVTVGSLTGVWLPVVGQPTEIEVSGSDDRARDLRLGLRFNRSTRALIYPPGTQTGDGYTLHAVVTSPPAQAALDELAIDPTIVPTPLPTGTPPWVRTLAGDLVDEAKAETPTAIVSAITTALKTSGGSRPDQPGTHSLYRLGIFLSQYRDDREASLLGTPEQYASAAALLIRSLGIPVRVVVGFTVPAGETTFDVTRADATAWVEVPFQGAGWVRLDPVPDVTEKPTTAQQGTPQQTENVPPEPPPAAVPPVPVAKPADEEGTKNPPVTTPPLDAAGGGAGGSGPVLFAVGAGATVPLGAVLIGLLILAWKSRRRTKRRTGTPQQRISGAWAELIDRAKDNGTAVPRSSTRHEVATVIAVPAARTVAQIADRALFGDGQAADADADAMWERTDEAIAELRSGQSTVDRVRAAVNVSSLVGRR